MVYLLFIVDQWMKSSNMIEDFWALRMMHIFFLLLFTVNGLFTIYVGFLSTAVALRIMTYYTHHQARGLSQHGKSRLAFIPIITAI